MEAATVHIYALVRLLLILQLRGICLYPPKALRDCQAIRVETNRLMVGLNSASQLNTRLAAFSEARGKHIEVFTHWNTQPRFSHVLPHRLLKNVLHALTVNAA